MGRDPRIGFWRHDGRDDLADAGHPVGNPRRFCIGLMSASYAERPGGGGRPTLLVVKTDD